MILHKYQTEETCLRLYKSISGALFTSTTRSRSRQLGGRGLAKRGVWSQIRARKFYLAPPSARVCPDIVVVI